MMEIIFNKNPNNISGNKNNKILEKYHVLMYKKPNKQP